MYVCICHGVTDTDVADALAAGADTVDDVAEATGASTGCGACRVKLCRIVRQRQTAAWSTDAALSA